MQFMGKKCYLASDARDWEDTGFDLIGYVVCKNL